MSLFAEAAKLGDFRPLYDRVLLKRLERQETSRIIVPDAARQPAHRGVVIAVGDGYRNPDSFAKLRGPMQVKVGDVVCYQSSDMDEDGYILIQEADILGIETEV